MVASVAASAFFTVLSPLTVVSMKASKCIDDGPKSLRVRGIAAKPMLSSGIMETRAQAQALPNANNTVVGQKNEAQRVEEDAPSAPRTSYNELPVFLAAEKQFTLINSKPRRPDMLDDAFGLGKNMQDGSVFRQNFSIRSYEIGADQTASIETLMNYLQETALNHAKCLGLMCSGLGSTPEMSKRNLIWVTTRVQILVEKYPSWEDVVEVETWIASSGKNGMRRDWCVRDYRTGRTVVRATSVCVMMNKQTRRLSKIPEEVRAEIASYFTDRDPLIEEASRRLIKLEENSAAYVRKGLSPRWSDLDLNDHVNNVKYISWILESAPMSMLESHELRSLTLEYRRECAKDSVLRSLTAVVSDDNSAGGSPEDGIECQHLLEMESGAEIVRGRTEWRPKTAQGSPNHRAKSS